MKTFLLVYMQNDVSFGKQEFNQSDLLRYLDLVLLLKDKTQVIEFIHSADIGNFQFLNFDLITMTEELLIRVK